ncbi:MAG: uracil-DNA glycosylase [Syntrophales bacterium]|nr:uracil-DNA glycosylase [Syntrophales bacterium]
MTARGETRQELLLIVASLKGHLRETANPGRWFFLSGKKAEGSGPVDPLTQGVEVVARHGDERISRDCQETLADIRADLGNCQRCPLHRGRKNIVFGEGNHRARLVFVGEAPGGDEDIQGRPFVGRAGQLLTRIIEAMKMRREDVYICNILKCRPPGNRDPRPEEIAACEPFLIRQLAAIGPQVICALGTFAARTLLKTEAPITVLRGRFHGYQGIALMPTYHPAYLLRNPGAKKQVWEDVQLIMRRLEEARG